MSEVINNTPQRERRGKDINLTSALQKSIHEVSRPKWWAACLAHMEAHPECKTPTPCAGVTVQNGGRQAGRIRGLAAANSHWRCRPKRWAARQVHLRVQFNGLRVETVTQIGGRQINRTKEPFMGRTALAETTAHSYNAPRAHTDHSAQHGAAVLTSQAALVDTIKNLTDRITSRPMTEWTDGQATGHLELLEEYWKDFVGNHIWLIHAPSPLPHEYTQGANYAELEDLYLSAKGRLYDARSGPSSRPHSEHGSDAFEYRPRKPSHLPRIQIPRFNGQQADWEGFRDMFRQVIHKEDALSDVEKLYYLKAHLDGEAKSALESVAVTATNYNPAWETLCARYDNKRLLIRGHLSALLRLKPMKEESAAEIQRLVDTLERHRSQLSSLGRAVEHWDDWLVTVSEQAMDATTRREWEKDVGPSTNAHPTYASVKAFLSHRGTMLKSLADTQFRRAVDASRAQAHNQSHSTLSIRTLATATEPTIRCPDCDGEHKLSWCDSFKAKGLEEKRALVQKRGACWNCLGGGHRAVECPSSFTCRACGGKHHTLLHGGDRKRASEQGVVESGPFKRQHLSVAATGTQEPPHADSPDYEGNQA